MAEPAAAAVPAGADPSARRLAAADEGAAKRRKRAGKVPVIDVAPFFASGADDAQRRAVSAAVADACERVGFFVVVGHGIDPSVPRACAAEARHFFSLPREEKAKFAAGGRAYGFFPMNSEALGYNADVASRPDIREAFSMGPQGEPPASLERSPVVNFCYQRTPWPPDGRLEAAMSRYYLEAGKLADGMLRIFALALPVPWMRIFFCPR
ncbi:unnamed protein product [Prorocentrum cordatum]|uniref:Non-haem dioxygenase N-terminal domain-containing protein n=1 Tax=Prorocentrum cordatum TaxID=2364126 RepID=A0ABN9STE5_9DINO|nr:unnamed protein product [Polarella glacialis]